MVSRAPDRQAAGCGFSLPETLVVFEMEAADGVLCVQVGESETALDGTALACFQLHIDQDSSACARWGFSRRPQR